MLTKDNAINARSAVRIIKLSSDDVAQIVADDCSDSTDKKTAENYLITLRYAVEELTKCVNAMG